MKHNMKEKPEEARRDDTLANFDDDSEDQDDELDLFNDPEDVPDLEEHDEEKDDKDNSSGGENTEQHTGSSLGDFGGEALQDDGDEEDLFGGDDPEDVAGELFEDVEDGFLGEVEEEEDTSIDVKSEPDLTGSSEYDPDIYFHSSEDMSELEDDSVQLIVTSPPYNADWAYGSHDDQMDYQKEYLPMLANVFRECWRVLSPGGRLIINVPTLLRGGASGGQAILSDIDTMLNGKVGVFKAPDNDDYGEIRKTQEETDFVHREWIIWSKGFNDAGMAPNGSFPRPWGILMNNLHEGVSVYQKPGDRDVSTISDDRVESSKINKWTDDLCDDVWDISPVNYEFKHADEEDVPPFPEELVKRCVALWSYEDDTVLDPFLGRGTTCRVAKQMNRHSVGYELREEIKKDIERYVGVGQQTLF